MPSSLSTTEQFRQLVARAVAAKRSYEVCSVLQETLGDEKFEDVMRRYSSFFNSTLNANFITIVMALTALYDEKYLSLPALLREMRTADQLDENVKVEIESRIQQITTPLGKLCGIRHRVFAHISNKIADASAVFEGVTMDEVKDVIDKTWDSVDQIRKSIGEPPYIPQESSEENTRAILRDLLDHRKYQLAHPEQFLFSA